MYMYMYIKLQFKTYAYKIKRIKSDKNRHAIQSGIKWIILWEIKCVHKIEKGGEMFRDW